MDNQLTRLVYLGDLVLGIAVHCNSHPIAAAAEVVADSPQDVYLNIGGVRSEAVADEAMAPAVQNYEALPTGLVKCDQF